MPIDKFTAIWVYELIDIMIPVDARVDDEPCIRQLVARTIRESMIVPVEHVVDRLDSGQSVALATYLGRASGRESSRIDDRRIRFVAEVISISASWVAVDAHVLVGGTVTRFTGDPEF